MLKRPLSPPNLSKSNSIPPQEEFIERPLLLSSKVWKSISKSTELSSYITPLSLLASPQSQDPIISTTPIPVDEVSKLAYQTFQRNPGWVSLPFHILDHSTSRRRNTLSLKIPLSSPPREFFPKAREEVPVESINDPEALSIDGSEFEDESGDPELPAFILSPVILSPVEDSDSPVTVEAISPQSETRPEPELFLTPNPTPSPMANLMMMGLAKPLPFSGEKGSTPVLEFLDSLDFFFIIMEPLVVDADRMTRVKLLTFQSMLEGKAKQWWNYQARSEQKLTYETARVAIVARFPTSEAGTSEELGKAMAAFNVLKQNGRSVEDYIEHVTELHSVLGNDFQNLLAMRFINGIESDNTRQAVDAQVEEPYTLVAVLAAYRKSTKSIRRLESYQERKAPLTGHRNDEVLRDDPFREIIRNQDKMTAMYIESMEKMTEAMKGSRVSVTSPTPSHVPSASRAIPAGERFPTGYKPTSNWTPTCVLCGRAGHMSRDCQNPPVSADEQRKLREKYLRPRTDPPRQQIAGAAALEELTMEELGLISADNDPKGMVTMSIAIVGEMSRG